MRIGIDVRYLSHGLVGGVHTYVKQLVPALLKAAPEHEFVLYADTKAPFELRDVPANTRVRYLPYRNALSSIMSDFVRLRREMATDRVEVAHFPTNYGFGPRGAATVITLHDAINLMPLSHTLQSKGTLWDARARAMTIYLYCCSHLALRRADLVLTVSEHARREIAHYGHYDPGRIVAIHHGIEAGLRRVTDAAVLAEVRARYGLERQFILADGLKNPAVIVRAWQHLPQHLRDSHTIVFFSRREPLPVVREAEAAGHCRLLLNIPRADLVALYSMACAFVFPSWLEGFGIPIVEAMTCGAPVICADNSAMPEVAGGAALLCNAEDEHTLAAHLTRVLGNPNEAERLRALGYARARQFSWQRTAEQTIAAYHRAAGVPVSVSNTQCLYTQQS
ncbi:MAG: glycosyltransferase family 1 protein [Chloroflexaceae bacterium]